MWSLFTAVWLLQMACMQSLSARNTASAPGYKISQHARSATEKSMLGFSFILAWAPGRSTSRCADIYYSAFYAIASGQHIIAALHTNEHLGSGWSEVFNKCTFLFSLLGLSLAQPVTFCTRGILLRCALCLWVSQNSHVANMQSLLIYEYSLFVCAYGRMIRAL